MTNDSPAKAILVTSLVALACSIMVSTAALNWRPIQRAYADLGRISHIVDVAGLAKEGEVLDNRAIIELYRQLDVRAVDLDTGEFTDAVDLTTFDQRSAAGNPEMRVNIPAQFNIAGLGTRSRYALVYLLQPDDRIERIILPVHGQGMWSTMYAFIALQQDLNTIADIKFYEQGETPGIGDRVLEPEWRAGWSGKRLFDASGELRFAVAEGKVDPTSRNAAYQVDGFTGATITATAVGNLVRYWLGPHGFGPFLDNLRSGRGDSNA